jgi:hypothetical protein
MEVGGQHQAPAALSPGKRNGTDFTGSCLGLGAALDGTESPTASVFDPLTGQPATRCCTEYAIRATSELESKQNVFQLWENKFDKCCHDTAYLTDTHNLLQTQTFGYKMNVILY